MIKSTAVSCEKQCRKHDGDVCFYTLYFVFIDATFPPQPKVKTFNDFLPFLCVSNLKMWMETHLLLILEVCEGRVYVSRVLNSPV